MSDQSSGAVVPPTGAVGDGQTQDPNKQEPKSVSYETHSRLLNQKKKADEELEVLRNEKKQRDEDDAKKRGDYEALLKSREEELAKVKGDYNALNSRIMDARKLTAVISAAGSPIDPKWHGLIDTSKVLVNPETGDVDNMSATKVIEDLRKQWPEMFAKPSAPQLPANAPQGNGAGKISRAEWLKLDSKKMKEWKPDQIMDS